MLYLLDFGRMWHDFTNLLMQLVYIYCVLLSSVSSAMIVGWLLFVVRELITLNGLMLKYLKNWLNKCRINVDQKASSTKMWRKKHMNHKKLWNLQLLKLNFKLFLRFDCSEVSQNVKWFLRVSFTADHFCGKNNSGGKI